MRRAEPSPGPDRDSLLDATSLWQLHMWHGRAQPPAERPRVLFKASRDQWSAARFQQALAQQGGPTVAFAWTADGAVLGAYTSQPWKPGNTDEFRLDPSAFAFVLWSGWTCFEGSMLRCPQDRLGGIYVHNQYGPYFCFSGVDWHFLDPSHPSALLIRPQQPARGAASAVAVPLRELEIHAADVIPYPKSRSMPALPLLPLHVARETQNKLALLNFRAMVRQVEAGQSLAALARCRVNLEHLLLDSIVDVAAAATAAPPRAQRDARPASRIPALVQELMATALDKDPTSVLGCLRTADRPAYFFLVHPPGTEAGTTEQRHGMLAPYITRAFPVAGADAASIGCFADIRPLCQLLESESRRAAAAAAAGDESQAGYLERLFCGEQAQAADVISAPTPAFRDSLAAAQGLLGETMETTQLVQRTCSDSSRPTSAALASVRQRVLEEAERSTRAVQRQLLEAAQDYSRVRRLLVEKGESGDVVDVMEEIRREEQLQHAFGRLEDRVGELRGMAFQNMADADRPTGLVEAGSLRLQEENMDALAGELCKIEGQMLELKQERAEAAHEVSCMEDELSFLKTAQTRGAFATVHENRLLGWSPTAAAAPARQAQPGQAQPNRRDMLNAYIRRYDAQCQAMRQRLAARERDFAGREAELNARKTKTQQSLVDEGNARAAVVADLGQSSDAALLQLVAGLDQVRVLRRRSMDASLHLVELLRVNILNPLRHMCQTSARLAGMAPSLHRDMLELGVLRGSRRAQLLQASAAELDRMAGHDTEVFLLLRAVQKWLRHRDCLRSEAKSALPAADVVFTSRQGIDMG